VDGGYCTPCLPSVPELPDIPEPPKQRVNGEDNRFQELLDQIAAVGGGNPARLAPLYQEVQTISQDFIEMATSYGHVIISELHLPVSEKVT
jgi:tRNA A37 methylthiotransferase MiaB